MKADISAQELWMNHSLMSYFFRSQAESELSSLLKCSINIVDTFNAIDEKFDSLDDFEEFLYNESTDVIKKEIGEQLFFR